MSLSPPPTWLLACCAAADTYAAIRTELSQIVTFWRAAATAARGACAPHRGRGCGRAVEGPAVATPAPRRHLRRRHRRPCRQSRAACHDTHPSVAPGRVHARAGGIRAQRGCSRCRGALKATGGGGGECRAPCAFHAAGAGGVVGPGTPTRRPRHAVGNSRRHPSLVLLVQAKDCGENASPPFGPLGASSPRLTHAQHRIGESLSCEVTRGAVVRTSLKRRRWPLAPQSAVRFRPVRLFHRGCRHDPPPQCLAAVMKVLSDVPFPRPVSTSRFHVPVSTSLLLACQVDS